MVDPEPSLPDASDVAVIGAGGAGILAGIGAGRAGARTVLFERMKKAAKKVAISGGGRCNFSNALGPRDFVRLFGDRNSSFLGHALRVFSRDDLVEMLARDGVEGQIERNYRLYTKSGRGVDVVDSLVTEFQKAGGRLVLEARIKSMAREPDGLYRLTVEIGGLPVTHHARAVVVTTGGLSYPATGSSGDGYDWAKSFGHQVTPLRAALVGLSVEEPWARELQGLAWPDAEATLWPIEEPAAGTPGGPPPGPARTRPAKPICTERAEILFTHFGISGPAILDVSNAFVREGLARAVLRLDFFPDRKIEDLDREIIERGKSFPNRGIARALEGLLPARLLDRFEKTVTGGAAILAGQLPREARRALLDLMKGTTFHVNGTRGIEFGEVTAGGVDWKDIEPATLESRLSPGLFFAGEILDVAGRCGGFNLQAAFSTGFLAGLSAAQHALEKKP